MKNAPSGAYPWHYGVPVALYYGALSMYQGYMAKYYQLQGISAGSTQMMWLMAAGPLVALAAQPLWGMAGDRMRRRNTAVLIMGAASTLVAVLMPAGRGFVWLLVLGGMFAAFFTSIQPMTDSILLENMALRRVPFGPVRLMGSLGYALTNLLLAGLLEGRFHLVPWGTALFLVGLLVSQPLLPDTRGHQRARQRVPLRLLLSVPRMKPLLLLTVGLQLALGYYYSYFTLHFTSLPGGTSGMLGLAYFVAAAGELPFLLLSQRLYRRYGAGKLMVGSALLMCIRFFIMGMAPNAALLVVAQALHGGNFIVIALSMSLFINENIPDELKAAGQMMLAVVAYGIARVFGTFAGALISRAAGGPSGGFFAMSALCLVCFVPGALYFFRLPGPGGKAAGEKSFDTALL